MLKTKVSGWLERFVPAGLLAVFSCRYCLMGKLPRWRADTQEYCHDFRSGQIQTHTFCKATKHWTPNG